MSKLKMLLACVAMLTLAGCAATANSLAIMSALLNNAAVAVNASSQTGYAMVALRQQPQGYAQPYGYSQYAAAPYMPGYGYGAQYMPVQQYAQPPQYAPPPQYAAYPQYAPPEVYQPPVQQIAFASEAQAEAATDAYERAHARAQQAPPTYYAANQQTPAPTSTTNVDADLDYIDANI